MSSDQRLQELAEQLSKTVNRIDQLQKKPTLTARLGRHLRVQSSHILNVVLAGCVLSVALGRMAQKHEHEEEKERWSAEREKFARQTGSLLEQLQQAEADKIRMSSQIQEELQSGGWRLGPVAARIHHILAPSEGQSVVGQELRSMKAQLPANDTKADYHSEGGPKPRMMI